MQTVFSVFSLVPVLTMTGGVQALAAAAAD